MPGPAATRFVRPSAAEWSCLIAGLALSVHYAWLMDDAFVYFRYLDNWLILKLGLVYNHGEYVEGYSSPLWLLVLGAFRATGLDYWTIVRLLAMLSFAATWACLVIVNRRLAPPSARTINLPLLFLTFNYGVQTSFSSGLETPLVQLAAAGFALHLVRPASRTAQVIVALAPLVRHELALPFIIVMAWCWWRQRRCPWLPLVIAALSFGGWLFFRLIYYADFLPNTFYLKNSIWPQQGLRYLADTLNTYWLHGILACFAIATACLRRRGLDVQLAPRLMMLACAIAVTAYVVKIGGDFLHYRYLAFPFVLATASCAGLLETVMGALGRERHRVLAWSLASAVAAGSWLLYPRQLDRHPATLSARPERDCVIEDAMAHRLRPELARNPWARPVVDEARRAYANYRAAQRRYTFESLVADYWCVRIYEQFNLFVVHSLGLTDPVLSRINVPMERPGHRWHLHPLGQQIVRMRARHGFGAGMYRRAIAAGDAPDWVVANAKALYLIDRRAYNRHRLGENLSLAWQRPGRIELVSPPPPIPYRRVKRLGS